MRVANNVVQSVHWRMGHSVYHPLLQLHHWCLVSGTKLYLCSVKGSHVCRTQVYAMPIIRMPELTLTLAHFLSWCRDSLIELFLLGYFFYSCFYLDTSIRWLC